MSSGVVPSKENACKTEVLRAADSVSERAVAAARSRGRKAPLFAQFRAALRPRSGPRARRPARSCSGVGRSGARRRRLDGSCLRDRPGREADRRRRRAAPAISAARWPSSNAQIESVVLTCSVPSRAIRAGHALRAIASPTASGQRATTSARPACGPKRDELAADRDQTACPGVTSTTCAGSTGSAQRCVAVITTCSSPATRSASDARGGASRAPRARRRAAAAAARRAAPPPRAGARAPRGAARPASRSCAGRARRRRSRTSSRCGPSPVEPRRRSASSRASRAAAVGGSRVVAERAVGKAELAGHGGEARRERRDRRPAARATSSRAELGHALRPRRERGAVGEPELHAAQRRVPLRERRGVVLRQPGAGRLQAAERAVEVRAPRRRAALDDGEPVGREHERRELAAQRLRRGQARAVELGRLRRAVRELHAHAGARRRPASTRERDRARRARRSGSAGRRRACAARSPACRRGAPRAGSSCRRRSRPTTSTMPGARSRSSDAYER